MSVTVEVLNNGQPFTEGRYTGQIGRRLKFDNGDPSQNVYAANETELVNKIAMMYGNTRTRMQELKNNPAAPKPAGTTTPAAPTRMTPEQRIQAAADLQDPARMGETIVRILKDETGFDPQQQQQQQQEQDAAKHRREVVDQFIATTPEYFASKRNGALLRDRVAANFGNNPTVEQWGEAFRQLEELGVLESAPATPQTPEVTPSEPSAPAPARTTGTGLPPSSRSAAPRTVSGTRMTREELLKLAHGNPSEYGRRLQDPAFAEMANKLLA